MIIVGLGLPNGANRWERRWVYLEGCKSLYENTSGYLEIAFKHGARIGGCYQFISNYVVYNYIATTKVKVCKYNTQNKIIFLENFIFNEVWNKIHYYNTLHVGSKKMYSERLTHSWN